MYLIRKGEKPRPVCKCNRAGPEGLQIAKGFAYRCDVCYEKLVQKRLSAANGKRTLEERIEALEASAARRELRKAVAQ